MTTTNATPRHSPAAFRGCLLGGAIGDALGAGVEFLSLSEIRAAHGPAGVTGYVPAYGRAGAITDDTQMTLFTAEALVRARRDGRPAREAGHAAYLRWLATQGDRRAAPAHDPGLLAIPALHARRAPGATCLAALRRGRAGTRAAPLNDSKGCGGVMRVAPVGLAAATLDEAFDLGCDLAAITHGHPTGWIAAGVLSAIVWGVVQGDTLEAAARRTRVRLVREPDHAETLASLDAALGRAAAAGHDPTPRDVEALGGGWVAEEALGIGLFCALVARDLPHGLLLAVNHGGDSDSTGAIAGNLLGLVHGEAALPAAWLEALELREVIAGAADELWRAFGPSSGT